MSGFDLFSLIQPIPTTPTTLPTTPTTLPTTPTTIPTPLSLHEQILCQHWDTVEERGEFLCRSCGIQISQPIVKPDEYFGRNERKQSVDPTRCYIRRSKDKTIYSDVKHMNISEHIKDIANKIYLQACGRRVRRGVYRRSIIFAAIFHAYKLDNNPQSCESLIHTFQIKKKDALKGLKFLNENAPKDSPIRAIYVTPEHLIREYLTRFSIPQEREDDIISVFRQVDGKSSLLNRSRPQSVAAGVIWYWIRKEHKGVPLKDFTQKMDLSELTINKISKEITKIINLKPKTEK
jgi:transcription initiation factor TFIIIB Brf1 subunit/transcription initiation factor TFIIB